MSARPMHGPGRGMVPGEKAKDFKGTIGRLLAYMGKFKFALIGVLLFAVGSTVFNVVGPKILGQATTELFHGLMAKVQGTGGIDFGKIGMILLLLLGLYVLSALFAFVQGWIMTGVTQKLCYRLRRDISEKIHRMPMKYFESKTVGEVLSRITNDIDTLGQSLNQSVTQLITSVTTILGVIVMMLSINTILTGVTIIILPVSMLLVMLVVKRSKNTSAPSKPIWAKSTDRSRRPIPGTMLCGHSTGNRRCSMSSAKPTRFYISRRGSPSFSPV